MKKVDMISLLDEWGVEHDDNFKNIQKLYYSERKNRPTNEEVKEEVKEEITELVDVFEGDKIRNILLREIIVLFKNIVGKRNGTSEEISEMFRLYNNFYKRSESPNCSVCVNKVYQKLLVLYKKYKNKYD